MLNKRTNKFAEQVDNNQSVPQKPKQPDKPQTYEVSDNKSKGKTIAKWIVAIVIIGLLIWMFYYSCSPKSTKITVKEATPTANSLTLKTNGGTEVNIKIASDDGKLANAGWSEYYLNLGNSTVYTMYASSDNYGTVSFRVEEWTAIDSSDQLVTWICIGSVDPVKLSTYTASFQTWLTDALTNHASVASNNNTWSYILINLLPTIILVALMVWMYNRMAKLQGGAMGGEDSIFGMGKSQAKIAQSNVKFSDVAGIEEEKAELIEIVDYLKNPEKYAAMGARTPRGVILYGPPGTGKTLLAKAVAGEAKVPFFQVSGSAFEDM